MFFLKYDDRLTTRAAVHPSLPASMVSQIDPEPGNRNRVLQTKMALNAEASPLQQWWHGDIVIHRHTRFDSTTTKLDAFLRACSSKELDLHGLIRFLECSWCRKYQNIPCASALTPAPTILSTFFTLIPFFQSPPLWLVSKNHPAYSLSVPIGTPPLRWLFPSFSIAEAMFIHWHQPIEIVPFCWRTECAQTSEQCEAQALLHSVKGQKDLTSSVHPLSTGRNTGIVPKVFPNALESQACQD